MPARTVSQPPLASPDAQGSPRGTATALSDGSSVRQGSTPIERQATQPSVRGRLTRRGELADAEHEGGRGGLPPLYENGGAHMRTVALVFSAIITLAVAACGDDSTDTPVPAPTDTPLSAPTAPASAALKAPAPAPTVTPVMAVAVEVAPAHSPTPTHTPVPTSTQPPTPTQAPTPAPASTHTPTPAPVPTDTPTSSPTATETPSPVPTQLPPPLRARCQGDRHRSPDCHPHGHRHEHPRSGPVPTPSVDPALASYSSLLVEAVSSYPAGLDFVGLGHAGSSATGTSW